MPFMATILKNLPRIGTKLKTQIQVPGLGLVKLGGNAHRLLPSTAVKLAERVNAIGKETEFDLDADGVADVIRTEASLRGEPYVMYQSTNDTKEKGKFVIYGGTDGKVHLIDRMLETGETIVLGDQTANHEGAFLASVSHSGKHRAHLTDRNADGRVDLVTWRAADGVQHFRIDDDFDGQVDREGKGQP